MYTYIGILLAILFFIVFAILLPLSPKGRIFLYNQLGKKETVFGEFFGDLQEAVETGKFKPGDMGIIAIGMLVWSVLVCMASLIVAFIYPVLILYSFMVLIISKQTKFKK